ncbi:MULTISPECIES: ABC transporter permease [unclassified Plantactinospora]|uniref:ABC transporter permease n=1 Tax=unclassified Plantactinospora TaxID=2631981 RepID=UPI000D1686A9|nr:MULTISPECIES: ABC transporter permease [unclassified Plantactinospora]AVT31598.1 ABC transporter permease [Plantactinospora sp. BC1]AVT38734.1 ABC transporter permease [Plantactinospora sp. BB1]
MNRLIRAEFRRLLASRLWLVALAIAVLCGAGLIGLLTLLGPENFDPPMPGLDTETGVRAVLGMVGYTMFIPAVLGTLAVSAEYRHRTVDFTFLFAPRRWQVLVSKLVAYGVAGLAYGLVLTGSGAAVLFAGAAARDVTPGLGTGSILELFARLAVSMAVYTLLGVGIGALVGNQVAALGVVVGYFYLLEPLLAIVPGVSQLYPYLPAGATASLTGFSYVVDAAAEELGTTPVQLVSPLGGGLLLLGYAAVAAVLAVAVPMRRDVT